MMELTAVSRQRRRIMGFAMMWIVFFHIELGENPGFLVWFIHRIGFYGVDLFLLISGLGLWFSLKKDENAGRFYARRAVRILPAYLVVCCIYYAIRRVSAGAFIVSVSTVGYWIQATHFDWFIPTLVMLYLLTPGLVKLYKKLQKPLLFVLAAFAVSALLCAIAAVCEWLDILGSFVRLPVFCLGLCLGDRIDRATAAEEAGLPCPPAAKVKALPCLAALLLGVIMAYGTTRLRGNLAQAGLNAYPALIVAPALAVVLGCVFDFIAEKWGIAGKVLLSPFDFFGRYSLEIYLLHERIQELRPGFGVGKTLLIMLIGAVILHEIIEVVIKLIRKAAAKKAA